MLTFGECNGGLLRIDCVEDSFVADFALRDEGNFAPYELGTHGCWTGCRRRYSREVELWTIDKDERKD